MKRQAFARAADQQAAFEHYRKLTRCDAFLQTMAAIMPSAELRAVVHPHCPEAGGGRVPIGLERVLRIDFVQH